MDNQLIAGPNLSTAPQTVQDCQWHRASSRDTAHPNAPGAGTFGLHSVGHGAGRAQTPTMGVACPHG